MPKTSHREKRVTMSDVARAVGCSQSTVSIVLNGNQSISISPDTREKVIEAARNMGYKIRQAELLNTAITRAPELRRVGFLIDSLSTSPEGIMAIRGVQNALQDTGAVLVIYEVGNDPKKAPAIIDAMVQDGVEAFIYACIFTRDITVPDALRSLDRPYVLLNCTDKTAEAPSIVPSEIAGGQSATNALIAAGHQRIGTIMGEDFMSAAQDRLKGYRRALATADIPFDPALVQPGDWSASAGYSGTKALMETDNPPTAIFCQNDRMAIGCYEYLKERGLRIPEDVSVIGYDDEEISRHLTPMLTTVNLPHREMGEWAVERLIGTDDHGHGPTAEKLECELVPRDSIAARSG